MRTFSKLLFAIVVAFGLQAAAGEARADEIIFSNFGPGMTFNTSTGWNVSGANVFGGRVVAQSFSPLTGFTFSNAQLAIGIIDGPNLLQVVLMTSSGALQQPDTIIETITLTNAVSPFTPSGIVLANSTLHPVLNPGEQYWLVAFAPNDTTFMAWNFSVNDSPQAFSLLNGSHSLTGPWEFGSPRGAFQVVGTPIPEPATILLLGPALAVITLRRRRRRNRQT